MELTGENVEKTFVECLFKEGEDTSKAIMAQGVTGQFGFNPDRLQEHKADIASLAKQLPDEFKTSGGGGSSFLKACNNAKGEQWTGLQQFMELLLVMGIATGVITYPMSKEMWDVLPGGVPYFTVHDS